jgi:phosphatidylserine decarboxylase
MMVGSIVTTVHEGDWVERGQELGYFAFGQRCLPIIFRRFMHLLSAVM